MHIWRLPLPPYQGNNFLVDRSPNYDADTFDWEHPVPRWGSSTQDPSWIKINLHFHKRSRLSLLSCIFTCNQTCYCLKKFKLIFFSFSIWVQMYTIKSYRNNLIISTFLWRLLHFKNLWWANVRWEFVLLSPIRRRFWRVGCWKSPDFWSKIMAF